MQPWCAEETCSVCEPLALFSVTNRRLQRTSNKHTQPNYHIQSHKHTINMLYLKRSTSWTVGRTMDTRLSLCEWKIRLITWCDSSEHDTSAGCERFIPAWTGRAETSQACRNTWGCAAEESRRQRSLMKCYDELISYKERKNKYLHDHTHDGEREDLPRTRRGPAVNVITCFNTKTKHKPNINPISSIEKFQQKNKIRQHYI